MLSGALGSNDKKLSWPDFYRLTGDGARADLIESRAQVREITGPIFFVGLLGGIVWVARSPTTDDGNVNVYPIGLIALGLAAGLLNILPSDGIPAEEEARQAAAAYNSALLRRWQTDTAITGTEREPRRPAPVSASAGDIDG